jgi:ABC-type Fe3+/spermidine/putrescine transport system ATPase subunit
MDHFQTPTLPPALEIRGLRKSFARPAVDGFDLSIRAGEFYMLLGPNGAGKTTTLRMVSGLMQPDAGAISVFGIDAPAHERCESFSRGMRQKVALTGAPVHEPKLIIPDEPPPKCQVLLRKNLTHRVKNHSFARHEKEKSQNRERTRERHEGYRLTH